MVKDIFGVSVYFVLSASESGNQQHEHIDKYPFTITQFSAIFEVIEAMPFSILQSLFFLIPNNMYFTDEIG